MATLVTDINQLDLEASYTYADYLLWRFEERLELIKGRIFKMSPAPSTRPIFPDLVIDLNEVFQ